MTNPRITPVLRTFLGAPTTFGWPPYSGPPGPVNLSGNAAIGTVDDRTRVPVLLSPPFSPPRVWEVGQPLHNFRNFARQRASPW